MVDRAQDAPWLAWLVEALHQAQWLLLRLLLLGNNGRIRLADPAHVLGHVTPAHNNDEAQKDGDDQIFSVLHEGVHSWDSGGTSRGRLGGGTGSYPEPPHGWQRARRLSASQPPRKMPWVMMASAA